MEYIKVIDAAKQKTHKKVEKKIVLLPNLYFNSVAQKQESSFKILG